MFVDAQEQFATELQRLDLLLHREILRLRAAYQLSLDEFRGLYVSDRQVDSLLERLTSEDNSVASIDHLTNQAAELRRVIVAQNSPELPWMRVVKEFELSEFEQDVLLLALAPELQLKYLTLYAYLNNDVTRKLPTIDLALRLFSANVKEQINMRKYLFPSATLFRSGLLRSGVPPSDHFAWLATPFFVPPFVSQFLVGIEQHFDSPSSSDCRLPTTLWDDVPVSGALRSQLARIADFFRTSPDNSRGPVIVFEGHKGTGRRLAAEAVCRSLGISVIDFTQLAAQRELDAEFAMALLRQRLTRAAIYVEQTESFFDNDGNPLREACSLFNLVTEATLPVFFACAPGTASRAAFGSLRCLKFTFGELTYAERLDIWRARAARERIVLAEAAGEIVAGRFVLTAGQIENAITTAVDARQLRAEQNATVNSEDVFQAARAQSDQSLGKLAVKVGRIFSWEDLVLPAPTLRQVKEVAAAIKNRHVVYAQWGFEHRVAFGRGLKVLFSGASGTGKTMTAGVIARELGLDLYKIDLSSVVSKYIGETEKNLDQIFRAAHSSNAILFFDEADALFGKRSEVKDAHDRYANIEVAYLLQKLEEHEGAVILASNLSRNIDDAFSRRMHYVVQFPLPNESYREQLWRGMFPAQTPLSEDIDFGFLARQFPMSGGDIKNVALDAAFLAADDGQVITMKQLVKAMARQVIKQGKIPSVTDFKQYHAFLARDA